MTDRLVTQAVDEGASTISDVAARCGAGSDCGGCHRRLSQLLANVERLVTISATAA